MISEKGSRRTWRSSLTHDRAQAPHAGSPPAPLGRAASAASTWWMKTSSSEGRMRSIEDGRVAGRGEELARSRAGPRSASRTTTWMRVPKTEVSTRPRLRRRAPRAPRRRAARCTSSTASPGEDLLQLGDRAERHEPAGVDEGEAVAVLGLVEVVGGDEDRDARRPPSRRSGARSAGARSGRRRSWARRGRRRAARAARRRRGPAAASSRRAARR